MENPCVKYGEHLLPHPDSNTKQSCLRCGHNISDPILTQEEIANGRRKIGEKIVEENLELFAKASRIADRDKKDAVDVFMELSRKEQ